ncbi:MAG: DUF481 domain-containing protein [Rickettsiales bacterium]|nr:DUF481 domain-containing protein [Rickettsiales bacterium]
MYPKQSFMRFAFLCSLSMAPLSNTASADTLPQPLMDSLSKAYHTKDSFILDAVTQSAKNQNPSLQTNIDAYVSSLKVPKAAKTVSKPKKKDQKDASLSGNIEFGASLETGNTEKDELNTNATVSYKKEQWQNITKLKASNGKEDDTRYDEEYRINNQVRFNRSKKDYFFGELEYVNDRFSGFDYRISELAGYGYHLLSTDTMSLSLEASVGGRQSKLSNSETENSFLGKIAQNYAWDINQNLSFEETLGVSLSQDSTITEFEAALKSKITDSLYLKAGFELEHISDVPDTAKNTDTVTSLTIGYDF